MRLQVRLMTTDHIPFKSIRSDEAVLSRLGVVAPDSLNLGSLNINRGDGFLYDAFVSLKETRPRN